MPHLIKSIGNIDAYSDKDLQHCFIELDYFRDFALLDEKMYLVGRRGSGKSASVLKLLNQFNGSRTLITWEKSEERQEMDFAALVIEILIDIEENTYRPIWNSIDVGRFLQPIWKHLILVALMNTVLRNPSDKNNQSLSAIKLYLDEKNYRDVGPFAIFKGIALRLARCLDLDSRSAKLIAMIEEIDRLMSDPRLAEATASLKTYLARTGENHIVLIDAVIDRVAHHQNLQILQKIVLSLMTAVYELQPFPGNADVQIKCTVPGEIADSLEYFDLAKLRVGCCRTEWGPRDLRRMTERRLRYRLEEAGIYLKEADDPWIHLFPKKITNRLGLIEDSFFYLCRHSHHYPREIILAVNDLLNALKKNLHGLSEKQFVEAINQSASTMTDEFQFRYNQAFPEFTRLLSVFEEESKVLSFASLTRALKQVVPRDPIEIHRTIVFLMRIGFLGIISNMHRQDSPVYEAHFAFITGRTPLYNEESYFAIHPMFYDRLKIRREADTRYVYPESYKLLEIEDE